jgi:U3 small nucleolar RNA-associated protein 14
MKRIFLILALLTVMPAAHAHSKVKDKLQQCYRVESARFDCDDLDDDQLDEVIETGGLTDDD